MVVNGNQTINRVRVKVCGITTLEDALQAIAAGADALGFVFYPKSPRYIEVEAAQRIIAQLPPFVAIVGLFVNADPAIIKTTIAECNLDVVQLHGDETPAQCEYAGVKVIKALRVRSSECLQNVDDYPVAALLIDAWSEDAYGGTGQLGRWDLAAQIAKRLPVILAGGLNKDNVAQAIAAVHPYAVDVSSGIEIKPGHKDSELVRDFIYRAKKWE
ncbi:MAG: N-(5'-phosphoribosyl)anthranilate isomerase [Desulfobacteraceae bacterium 4572_35.1]|nr:MAG: N-(5'-phosphoribosyl)anthranilate isomerase [Desulfobacteraceae bacterium 4572_35.1]